MEVSRGLGFTGLQAEVVDATIPPRGKDGWICQKPDPVDGCEIHKPHHFETMVDAMKLLVFTGESSETRVLRCCEMDFVHPQF